MHHIPVADLAAKLGAEGRQSVVGRVRLLVGFFWSTRLFFGLEAEVQVDVVGRLLSRLIGAAEVQVDGDLVLDAGGVAIGAEVDVEVVTAPRARRGRTGSRLLAAGRLRTPLGVVVGRGVRPVQSP